MEPLVWTIVARAPRWPARRMRTISSNRSMGIVYRLSGEREKGKKRLYHPSKEDSGQAEGTEVGATASSGAENSVARLTSGIAVVDIGVERVLLCDAVWEEARMKAVVFREHGDP